jgi:hypothetical protein
MIALGIGVGIGLFVGVVLGAFLGYFQGHHKGYCLYWGKDLKLQFAMSPRQWRIAYGYEKVTND